MHDLFEELDAFCPYWRDQYRSIRDAAYAAGPHALLMYHSWIRTDDGANYERLMFGVPNYAAANESAADAAARAYELED